MLSHALVIVRPDWKLESLFAKMEIIKNTKWQSATVVFVLTKLS